MIRAHAVVHFSCYRNRRFPFSVGILCLFSGLVFLSPLSPASSSLFADKAPAPAPAKAEGRLAANYGKLALSFEVNLGQTDQRVKFLSRGRGYALFLTRDEAVLRLRKPSLTGGNSLGAPALGSARGGVEPTLRSARAGLKSGSTMANNPTADDVIHMRLLGANSHAVAMGAEELPGKFNYFLGNDPRKWRTNVPTYAQVKYRGVYPGVDLVYYGNQGGQLEYDFVVAPGADPSAIGLAINGDVQVGSRQSAVGSRQRTAGRRIKNNANPKSKIQNRQKRRPGYPDCERRHSLAQASGVPRAVYG